MTSEEISGWIADMKQDLPPEGGCHNCLDNPAYICCEDTWCWTHYHVHKNSVDMKVPREPHRDFYIMQRPAEPEPRGGETIREEYS